MLDLCLFGLLVCMLIQLGYYRRFYRGFARYTRGDHHDHYPFSIVIAARNEAEHLESLVAMLCNQKYAGKYEIIIVNDRSTDGSEVLLKTLAEENDCLRVIHLAEKPGHINGKKYAITQGIQQARYDHILLTDADCLPHGPHWLAGMASSFNSETVFVLGFSMYRSHGSFLDQWIYYETLLTGLQYLGFALTGRPYMGVGRNLSYVKKVFTGNDGFAEFSSITGGDDDLFVQKYSNKENTSVQIGAEVTTWTEPEKNWRSYANQKIRHLSVGRHYSPATQVLLGVFSLSHIFGYIFMGSLLWVEGGLIWAAGALVFRTLFVLTTFKKACQKLEMPFFAGKILLMDLLFPAYYVVFGTTALVRRKIRWK